MAFEVEYNNLDGIAKKLQKLENSTNRTEEALKLVGEAWLGHIRSNINKGIDPYGKKFAPINYVKYRYNSGSRYSNKTTRTTNPLLDTGRLVGSINITNLTKNSLTIGTPLVYARMHNEGLKNVKKRTFIPLNNIEATNFINIADKALDLWLRKEINDVRLD